MDKEQEQQLRRCLELVDQLSVSAGALTFAETALTDMVAIMDRAPPWSPRQSEVLRLIGEWPRKPGAIVVIDWPEDERPSLAPDLDRRKTKEGPA